MDFPTRKRRTPNISISAKSGWATGGACCMAERNSPVALRNSTASSFWASSSILIVESTSISILKVSCGWPRRSFSTSSHVGSSSSSCISGGGAGSWGGCGGEIPWPPEGAPAPFCCMACFCIACCCAITCCAAICAWICCFSCMVSKRTPEIRFMVSILKWLAMIQATFFTASRENLAISSCMSDRRSVANFPFWLTPVAVSPGSPAPRIISAMPVISYKSCFTFSRHS